MAKKMPLSGHSFGLIGDMVKNRCEALVSKQHDKQCVTWDELDRTLVNMDKLCTAYRMTMEEKIKTIKKAIYLSSAAVGFAISIFEIVLHYFG